MKKPKQFFLYIVIGGFNTLLGYALIFTFMYGVGFSPEWSNLLGYAMVLCVSYCLNKNFTFRNQGKHSAKLPKFFGVFIMSYLVNFCVLFGLIELGHIPSGLCQILAGCAYVMSSFLMQKYWVFKNA